MITKDGRDLPIEKLTPENYIVPQGEEKSYHCVIEVVRFDQKTRKRISKPRVQKFGKKTFESSVLASLLKQGYTVTVLHDPNAWLKKQAAKAAERAKQQAAEKTKAEQERFDAAVAAAVEKKMAEMQKNNGLTGAPDYSKENPEYAQGQKKPGRPANGAGESDNEPGK